MKVMGPRQQLVCFDIVLEGQLSMLMSRGYREIRHSKQLRELSRRSAVQQQRKRGALRRVLVPESGHNQLDLASA
jgi:hypothetical protein